MEMIKGELELFLWHYNKAHKRLSQSLQYMYLSKLSQYWNFLNVQSRPSGVLPIWMFLNGCIDTFLKHRIVHKGKIILVKFMSDIPFPENPCLWSD